MCALRSACNLHVEMKCNAKRHPLSDALKKYIEIQFVWLGICEKLCESNTEEKKTKSTLRINIHSSLTILFPRCSKYVHITPTFFFLVSCCHEYPPRHRS